MTSYASAKRTELKAFLRTRRAALVPESYGFERGRRRLAPGLRREEVASLAGVSMAWYTWLEQGRQINVSAATMKRISLALRLSPTDETYLRSLTGLHQVELQPTSPDQLAFPQLQSIMDTYEGPAFVLSPLMEVLGFNSLANRLYDFTSTQGRLTLNHLWAMFMNPTRRRLYVDFDDCVPSMLGIVRMNYALRIGDPDFECFIEELCDSSSEFARLWAKHYTSPLAPPVSTRMVHSTFGKICVHSTRFAVSDADGSIIVFLAPADVATRKTFKRLASEGQK